MARGPATFRQRDVTALVKALGAAGKEVSRVEIEGGRIIVIIGASGEAAEIKRPVNEWLERLGDDRARSRR